MPYPRAHWFVLALLPITVAAFWPSYFGAISKASASDHLHGITGTAWLLLVAAQSWSIHSARRDFHRQLGLASFLLGPLMIAGFAFATYAGAVESVNRHPFYLMFGQALLTADVLLTLSTSLTLYLAFRFRRQVRVHSALMLSTLIALLPPVLARLFAGFVPGFLVRGPETLPRFEGCLTAGMVIAILIALSLYRRQRDRWPWLLAAGFTLLCYGLYLTVGQAEWWATWVAVLAAAPVALVIGGGFALGLAACLLGWFAKAPSPPATRVANRVLDLEGLQR